MNIPILKETELIEWGGWSLYRQAQEFLKTSIFLDVEWAFPKLRGVIVLGAVRFTPCLNLRSKTFVENQCNCPRGSKGYICAHAIALYLNALKSLQEEVSDKSLNSNPTFETNSTLIPKSIKISQEKGIPLYFKIIIPPNLKDAAQRNSIIVRLIAFVNQKPITPEKIDRGRAYALSVSNQQVAALLESWCEGRLAGILQLKRSQLKQILDCVQGESVVYWANALEESIIWVENELINVHTFLKDTSVVPPLSIESKNSFLKKEKNGDSATTRANNTIPLKNYVKESKVSPSIALVDGSKHYLAIQLQSREVPYLYETFLEILKQNGFQLEPSNRKWWLRDSHKVLNFLAKYWQNFQQDTSVSFTENFKKNTTNLLFAELLAHATTQVDNTFDLEVSIQAGSFPAIKIQQSIAQGQYYVEDEQSIYLLTSQLIENLETLQKTVLNQPNPTSLSKFKKSLRPEDIVDVEPTLDSLLSKNFLPPSAWIEKSKALRNFSALEAPPLNPQLNTILRPYQKIGVAWLWHLYKNNFGGILADEMGLGKTLQAVCLIDLVMQAQSNASPKKPCLVVCPAGLVENWKREFLKFSPKTHVFCYHRNQNKKQIKAISEKFQSGSKESFEIYDLILTSYTTLAQSLDLFAENTFSLIIADEAQHIKNRQTQNAQALKTLHAQTRFLLSGTPIENSFQDIISLFEFIMPGYLQELNSKKNLSNAEQAWVWERIKQRITPYILRRTKSHVLPELPEKIEQVIYCELEPKQEKLYLDRTEKTHKAIFEMQMANASEGKVRMAVFKQLMELRQTCVDPRIIDSTLSAQDSSKLKVLREIIQEAIDGNHRILIFSQFVTALYFIRSDLEQAEISYCYLDGQTRDRLQEVDRFNNSPEIPVFLISLKAGGVGLNLTGADTVVHYDPWWNPAVQSQATDRAHRIGQEKVVTSIQLITRGTIEERVLSLQESKRALLESLWDATESSTEKFSIETLKFLVGLQD